MNYVLNITSLVAKQRITIIAYTISSTTHDIECVKSKRCIFHSLVDVFEVRNTINDLIVMEETTDKSR
jgi:hypothetical protein